jgi:hypothetical protein
MKTVTRAVAALSVASTALVLQAQSASALSCADPSDWYAEAEHVFVGRISDTKGDRIELAVREVWLGPDLAERIWMERHTGMDMWFPFSRDGEVPEGYSSPEEYVVAADRDLVLGPCSLAPVGEGTYGVAGADSPRDPVAAGEAGEAGETGEDAVDHIALDPGGGSPEEASAAAPLAAGGAGVVGLGALAALLWRRRRTA